MSTLRERSTRMSTRESAVEPLVGLPLPGVSNSPLCRSLVTLDRLVSDQTVQSECRG